jgi:hypothetical protein
MMNVPLSVIIGKSPMKTVCSLISPVSLLMKADVTKSGREKVMSFSLHSDSSNFGSSKRCPKNCSARLPVKSSIGEMSLSVSPSPVLRNQSNDSFCTEIRLGGGRTSASLAKVRRSRRALDDKQASHGLCLWGVKKMAGEAPLYSSLASPGRLAMGGS